MAEVTITSDLEKQKWLSNYFEEYVRESGFMPYMGRNSNKVIVTKYELQEESGKTINIPLITRLTNSGVEGNAILDGAEEDMSVYNMPLSIDWRRNGVRVPKSTSYKTEIDLWGAAKDLLKQWEAEKLRDDIIESMMRVERAVNYGASSSTTRNNWLNANFDRVLFGATIANAGTAGSAVHATALTNLDTGADKLTTSIGSLARRIARSANPHIRPFRTETGREFYVMFCGARAFRDLKLDTAMISANRDARAREGDAYRDNPLFVDGDLWYDGILYHEVPEIDDIAAQTSYFNAAATAGDARPCFLCGAQAVAIAWGQTPEMRTDTKKDYEFRPGVAIEELLEVDKDLLRHCGRYYFQPQAARHGHGVCVRRSRQLIFHNSHERRAICPPILLTKWAATYPVYKGAGRGEYQVAWGSLSAATLLAAADLIRMCRVPAGATVLDGLLLAADLDTGTSGTLSVGWKLTGWRRPMRLASLPPVPWVPALSSPATPRWWDCVCRSRAS